MPDLWSPLTSLPPEIQLILGLLILAIVALWGRDLLRERVVREMLRESAKAIAENASAKRELAGKVVALVRTVDSRLDTLERVIMMTDRHRPNGGDD